MGSIAYITNFFPASTFVDKEVDGLIRRGVPLRTFSIRKPSATDLSKTSYSLYKSTVYLLPTTPFKLLYAHAYFFLTEPLKYLHIFLFVITRKYHNLNYYDVRDEAKFRSDRLRSFFHFCEAILFAMHIRKDTNITHIHAHYANHPTTLALVASDLTGVPFSFTAHAYDIWFDKLFLEEKVNAAKFVITCSKFGRAEILKNNNINLPEKISTIYHGVDIETFKPRKCVIHKSQLTILTVGRLSEEKAQRNLILACKMLKDEGYDFECQIVGDGPLFNYLTQLIHANQLQGTMKLVGKVVRENIREYYEMADIFVLPSLSENLPNVLVECLAMGIPAIASDIAGIPELIKHNLTGLLVKPNDVQELAEAIKLLIENRTLAESLAQNGRRLVCQDFNEEKCLDQLVSLYSLNRVITN